MQKISFSIPVLPLLLLLAAGCANPEVRSVDPMIAQAIEIDTRIDAKKGTAETPTDVALAEAPKRTEKAAKQTPIADENVRLVSGTGVFNPPPSVLQKVRDEIESSAARPTPSSQAPLSTPAPIAVVPPVAAASDPASMPTDYAPTLSPLQQLPVVSTVKPPVNASQTQAPVAEQPVVVPAPPIANVQPAPAQTVPNTQPHVPAIQPAPVAIQPVQPVPLVSAPTAVVQAPTAAVPIGSSAPTAVQRPFNAQAAQAIPIASQQAQPATWPNPNPTSRLQTPQVTPAFANTRLPLVTAPTQPRAAVTAPTDPAPRNASNPQYPINENRSVLVPASSLVQSPVEDLVAAQPIQRQTPNDVYAQPSRQPSAAGIAPNIPVRRPRSFSSRRTIQPQSQPSAVTPPAPLSSPDETVRFWTESNQSPLSSQTYQQEQTQTRARLAASRVPPQGVLPSPTFASNPVIVTPPPVTNTMPLGKVMDWQQQNHAEQVDLGLGAVKSVIAPYGLRYMRPYVGLASELDGNPIVGAHGGPGTLKAWWYGNVANQMRPDSTRVELTIESLLVRALANSKFVKALSDSPLIRERAVTEADAEFDTTRFLETRFNRTSEPVGNQLTVGPGGSDRFRENDFTLSGGLSRRTRSGAQLQIAQQVGLLNNNSDFIDPRNQGNARLTLNVSQPLLQGRGQAYNTSVVMLAKIDHRRSWDDVNAQLQNYVVDVTETYWQLYLERARLHQRQRHFDRGQRILAELEQRRGVDAVANQIARARAAVSSRKSSLIRSQTNVRNIESTLRGLVNDPTLYGQNIEVIPQEMPRADWTQINIRDAMAQALKGRTEIDQAIQEIRAAGLRLSVAQNELMPILDMFLETYLTGIRGDNDIGQAWVDSFSKGEPSYSVGLRYEIPIGNRAAKNRHSRRRLEMRQAIRQFQYNVEELMSEVEIAVREVETSYKEMTARHEAMKANVVDLQYFQKRWELLPGDDRSASYLLEDILEAHDRLAAEESNFAQTQVNYAMSMVNLKRALGTLLKTEGIKMHRGSEHGLQKIDFKKGHSAEAIDSIVQPVEKEVPAKDTIADYLENAPIEEFTDVKVDSVDDFEIP